MKSIGSFFKKLGAAIVRFFSMLAEDQITVYAAQAAFFIIVSTVPFTILLIGIARYVIDIEWLLGLISRHLDGEIGNILSNLVTEVVAKTGAPLFSITIVTVLWSASRGVFSVTRGIAGAYKVHIKENFLLDVVRSLIYTLVFILIIIVTLIVLVFAETIIIALREFYPVVTLIFNIIKTCAPIIMTVLLTLFFAIIYDTVSRKGRRFSRAEYKGLSGKLPRGFLAQLPGAAFASLGWVIVSYFFAIYLRYFPGFSYLYGSLTTLMFLMMWIYFCMFTLMLGAEINKSVFHRWNIVKLHKDRVERKKRRKVALERVRIYSASFGRRKK